MDDVYNDDDDNGDKNMLCKALGYWCADGYVQFLALSAEYFYSDHLTMHCNDDNNNDNNNNNENNDDGDDATDEYYGWRMDVNNELCWCCDILWWIDDGDDDMMKQHILAKVRMKNLRTGGFP